MSMCKSSMIMGALATKVVDWMKVPDEELATDINNMDLVGNVKAQEKQRQMTAMSPRDGQKKKQAKKAADDNKDDVIVILSGWKTKQQGGGKLLKEITDQWWGELIQAVSTHMDVANGHLEWIVSTAQSNGWKMQWHFLLMEGLVGQQQLLVLKLVEMVSTAGSGRAKEVIEDQGELQEPQGGESGGQEEIQGVPGGVL
ncbi:hypothetical protein ID866_10939 [Astraeus odoratus]|nr:hypothetical protein ID866_10939 [Astraeus odoratus]